MTANIFIDGGAGTTGLEIADRLAGRADLTLIRLEESRRKDPAARREALNDADAVVLCLPDEAAREAVALIDNPRTRVVDASTAHRVAQGWTYGFPELEPGGREAVAGATRVSNPGCYPTGFLALVRPLVRAGLLDPATPLTVNATSGYSGGGKAMITAFENAEGPDATDTAFRLYALGLAHKHVAEMRGHAGLTNPPLFAPAVARTYRGMIVEVPLPAAPPLDAIRDVLAEAYAGQKLVRVADANESDALSLVTIERLAGTDRLELFVFGNANTGQARLVAVLDNLGKGAAGAAVQNLNLMLGLDELSGLRLGGKKKGGRSRPSPATRGLLTLQETFQLRLGDRAALVLVGHGEGRGRPGIDVRHLRLLRRVLLAQRGHPRAELFLGQVAVIVLVVLGPVGRDHRRDRVRGIGCRGRRGRGGGGRWRGGRGRRRRRGRRRGSARLRGVGRRLRRGSGLRQRRSSDRHRAHQHQALEHWNSFIHLALSL